MENKEVNILDVFITIAKYKKFLFTFIFSITLLALIISLIWPKTYKSTAQFFPPPREKSGISSILNMVMQASSTPAKLGSEAMLVVMNSRDVKYKVIEKFNFDSLYNNDIPEVLLKKLESSLLIEAQREGGLAFNPLVALTLSYYDRDPNRAFEICNYYIHVVDSTVKEMNRIRLSQSLLLMEKRYEKNLEDLEIAENTFEDFQQRYGIFEIETQMEVMINNLAELKAQSTELDIQVQILKNHFSLDNSVLREIQEKKRAIDKQLNDLVQKTDSYTPGALFQPLYNMPGLYKKYGRLYRELTIQNKILEALYPQYEQLKLDFLGIEQGIQIVETPKIPGYKDKPKRAIIVLAGFFFSLLMGTLLVFLMDSYAKAKENDTEQYKKLVLLKNSLSFLKK